MQVLYLGRALRTKETLPDFHEKRRVTRQSRVFRGLTGSQQTPGFWGVTASSWYFFINSSFHLLFDLNGCWKVSRVHLFQFVYDFSEFS